MRASTFLLWVLTATSFSLGLSATPASAKDYVIEVVIFENLFDAETVNAPALYLPRITGALRLGGEKAIAANFTLIENELSLVANAESIKQAGAYRLLQHFAWRQPGLDDTSASAIRVNIGGTFKAYIPQDYQIYPDFIPASTSPSQAGTDQQLTSSVLSGMLKVRLGRFLHLDSKLVFTDTKTGTSYRMNHSRKMRSRELHYIDNPRFGMLVKILPVPEE